jgi:hypothetical protein
MVLAERMKLVATDVANLKRSFNIVPANGPQANVYEGISRSDRAIRLRTREGSRQTALLASIIADVHQGRRPEWHLQEAMGTDDFPLLFGDLLYRQLLGNYMPWPVTYPAWMRVVDVKDFRALNLYTIDGGQGILPQVKEHEPYSEITFQEGHYSISVLKYGQRYGISFEMVIQDDLNAFNSRPIMMATGARRSEEYLATTKLCDVNGPDASFFSSGNANLSTGALTIKNLQAAFKVLSAQTDHDGQPIMIDAVTLLVTPNDEITARNILNATQIRVNAIGGGGDADQFLYTQNWMSSRVKLEVNPYIPYVASSCSTNPWFLIANPNDLTQRPAFAFAFMRGRRTPQLFVRDPDAMMIGGGASSPLEGNFDNDDINYKIRHIFGATQVDPKMAVASFG